MSKIKFTPGVWRKRPLEDGKGIAFVEVISPTSLQQDADILCVLRNHADAHLFAASKRLYKALERIIDVSFIGADGECKAAFKEARQALAQARGEMRPQPINSPSQRRVSRVKYCESEPGRLVSECLHCGDECRFA